jgi:hypothetical protein
MDRIETFNSILLCINAQPIYQNIQDPVIKVNLIRQMDHEFYATLERMAELRQQECVGRNLEVMS